jgi:hypothetical protein
MKRSAILIIVIVTLCSLWGDDSNHPLWEKAREITENNWLLVPGNLEQITYQKSGKGKLKSQETVSVEFAQVQAEVAAFLITAHRDGEELSIDDEKVAELMKEDMKPDNSSLFHNFKGRDLKVKLNGKSRVIEGQNCVGFDYSYTKEDGEFAGDGIPGWGTVWLHEESGAPLQNEMSFKPPAKAVKDMSITYHYHWGDEGWFKKQVEMKFLISILLIKYNIEVIRNYDNYWEYEPVE